MYHSPRTLLLQLLLPALLLAGSAAGLYRLGDWQWRSLLEQQARRDLYEAQANSPRAWDFRGRSLVASTVHDLDNVQERDGELVFTTAGEDPYFALALQHEGIPARYHRMVLTVDSSEPLPLQLFFTAEHGHAWIYASPPVSLRAGQQQLELDLAAIAWTAVPQHADAATLPASPAWGGANGVVTLLRLDPGSKPGVRLRISQLSLAAPQPLASGGAPLLFDGSAQQREQVLAAAAGRQQRGELAVVAAVDGFVGERAGSSFFRDLKDIAPDAVLFPGRLPDSILPGDRLQVQPAATVQWPLASWRPVVRGVAVATVLLLLFLLWHHRAEKQLLRTTVELELCGVLSLLYCMWWLACHDGLWWLLLTAPAFVLACRQLVAQQPGLLQEKFGLHKPDRRAWAETGIFSLLLLAGWLCTFAVSERTQPVAIVAVLFSLVAYPLWALLQQFLMGPMLAATVSRLAGDRPEYRALCAVLVALVFALLHYPNTALMLLTLLSGTAWAWLYLRHRNIIPLALSHGVLGTLYFQLSPDLLPVDGNVGPAYFDWLL